jgi:hypothetical protein
VRHLLAENSQEQRGAGNQLTESLTAEAPSGDPLELLPLRQLVVFVVRAHQRPLSGLAELLGVLRKTVHGDLRTAIRTLSEHGAPAADPPAPARGRPYRCPEHAGHCPAHCSSLRRWLASFDRAMPELR